MEGRTWEGTCEGIERTECGMQGVHTCHLFAVGILLSTQQGGMTSNAITSYTSGCYVKMEEKKAHKNAFFFICLINSVLICAHYFAYSTTERRKWSPKFVTVKVNLPGLPVLRMSVYHM